MMLGVWAVVVGGALLTANALDAPVGESARDAAQPASPAPTSSAAAPGGLPPLAMVLDRALAPAIAALPPVQQVRTLRTLATGTGDARRSVELGSVLQLLGDGPGAEAAYRGALAKEPTSIAARVGLTLVEGAAGADGLVAGTRRMQELARAHPRSQVVSFNQGWLEIYRRRADPARRAWLRTVTLGPRTRLGRTAAGLLATLETGANSRNP